LISQSRGLGDVYKRQALVEPLSTINFIFWFFLFLGFWKSISKGNKIKRFIPFWRYENSKKNKIPLQ
jgi:hypothetical protein